MRFQTWYKYMSNNSKAFKGAPPAENELPVLVHAMRKVLSANSNSKKAQRIEQKFVAAVHADHLSKASMPILAVRMMG